MASKYIKDTGQTDPQDQDTTVELLLEAIKMHSCNWHELAALWKQGFFLLFYKKKNNCSLSTMKQVYPSCSRTKGYK